MSSNKVFSDNVKSKLRQLYADIDSVYECKPQITLKSGRIVTLSELENCIKNSVPNYRERSMDIDVEDSINYEAVETVIKALLNLPKSNETCCVKLIKVSNFKNVMFQHAKLEKGENKLKPACFKIEVPACLPNTVQNINTGYIIDVCTEIENYQIAEGKIVKSTRTFTQKKLVIVPQILTKNKKLVPQLCARDYEDSGPFTISLLNKTGESSVIFVYLYAYKVVLPYAALRFKDHEDSDSKVLKSKDSRTGRYVYNLSAGVLFNTGSVSNDNRTIEFSCFDTTKEPARDSQDIQRNTVLKTRVVMDNLCVFFSTRKREWCDSKLFTISGLFRPDKKYVAPIVAARSRYNINTHVCVFMESRMTLFTTDGTLNSRHLLMNGAMFDIPKYKLLKRARAMLVRDVFLLRTGCMLAKRMDSAKYNIDDLMLIYDYNLRLSDDADFMKNYYSKRGNETELFNCSNSSIKRTISSRVYKNMMLLCEQFVLDADVAKKPTTDPTDYNEASNDGDDDDGDNKNRHQSKRMKIC